MFNANWRYSGTTQIGCANSMWSVPATKPSSAQQRYMKVDPNNRLVADELEADWNVKLRALDEAQQQYEQQRQADSVALNQEQQQQVDNLASDFPRLWNDKRTPQRERKRMVRLLIEDVTLVKAKQLDVHVLLRGGATRSLSMPVPLPGCKSWQTDPEVVSEIDRLLSDYTAHKSPPNSTSVAYALAKVAGLHV